MGRLIDREAAIDAIRDLQLDPSTTQYIYSSDAIDAVKKQPAVDAVPLEPLCEWLAGYAAPPKYAIDEVNGAILDANDRARAWEYHWQHLMECGLLQEEQDGTDNP